VALSGSVHRVSTRRKYAATLALAVAGCGDLVPEVDEAGGVDATSAGDVAAEADIPAGVVCESDEDCAPYAACCVEPLCRDGVCVPFYVAACCTQPGPCASTTPFHAGTCAVTCEPLGCVASWSPPAGSCAAVLSSVGFDEASLAELTFDDPDPRDRVTWAPSAARPFAGRPSLHAGDVVCPTYYDGPLGDDCRPAVSGVDAGPVRLEVQSPWVTLPTDQPAFAEVWLAIDVGPGHVDGVVIEVNAEGFAPAPMWDSRQARPIAGEWTPVAIDLAPFAGRRVRVGVVFDTLDGRDNDHPGVYLGALAVRTACEAERACPAPGPCSLGREVTLAPLADTVCVLAPPDPGPACIPCQVAATCPLADTCDVARCEGGACQVSHELDATCCTPDPRWPGDGSFEAGLEPGWEADPGWAVSPIQSLAGEQALHFGLPDGSGLSEPGARAAGMVLSAPLELPLDAPVWSFGLWLSTEWDAGPSRSNPAGVDLLEALVVPAGLDGQGVPPLVVWSSSTELGGTTSGRWARVRVAVPAFAGQRVRLGFRFDTGDEHDNDHGGAFIDDARVFRACPGCGDELVAPACDPGDDGL